MGSFGSNIALDMKKPNLSKLTLLVESPLRTGGHSLAWLKYLITPTVDAMFCLKSMNTACLLY